MHLYESVLKFQLYYIAKNMSNLKCRYKYFLQVLLCFLLDFKCKYYLIRKKCVWVLNEVDE